MTTFLFSGGLDDVVPPSVVKQFYDQVVLFQGEKDILYINFRDKDHFQVTGI